MADETNTIVPKPPAICGIECDSLFGHYTYCLNSAPDSNGVIPSQLLLLYGDNGSGKTTIAQLLFHMLSREDGRGHRTFLAKTKFRRFCIRFDNGSSFEAGRLGDAITGPYTLMTTDAHGRTQCVDVRTSDDGAVKRGEVDDNQLHELFATCSASDLTIYYLSDNRVLQSDVFDDEPPDEWMTHHGRIVTRRFGDTMERMLVPSRTRDLTVGPSVWRAETWLRRQAIQASNAGEVTTSNIYTDIIKRITHTATAATSSTSGSLHEVVTSLRTLAERTSSFTALGLSQPVPITTLSKHLQSAHPSQHELLANVLEPYVDSIRSRLDAFTELQQRLSVFLRIINAFYRRKKVRVRTSDGIQVFDEKGADLDVSLLSSGEKQLMLLLCNILVATTQPSLFIIDEPELSLNVKWQRELVDSLLSLVEGSHVQFIMATHSIELLTRHKDCVLKLEDIEESRDDTC